MFLFVTLLHASTFVHSTETVQQSENVGHVVFVASPFFGHIIPSLDFAKYLSKHHRVTFVVSASKLSVLERRGFLVKNDNNLSSTQSQLEFIGLLDGNNDDFQVAQSNTSLEVESQIDRMREPLLQLLFSVPITSSMSSSASSSSSAPLLSTGQIKYPVHLIIFDMLVYVSIQYAQQRRVPAYVFVPHDFTFLTRYINISMGNLENTIVGQSFAKQVIDAISLAKGIIFNSIYQLNEQLLEEFRQQPLPCANVSIRFVAPLISETDERPKTDIITRVQQWLDIQWQKANESSSVIYLAFGSMAHLVPEQIDQIALALASYPLIWSLKANLHSYLPSTFSDDHRHLILDWAPQRFILSHPAIRLFISHGGWNSVLESMSAGKPTLVWPMFADQFINGYRLEHHFGMGRCIQNTKLGNKQRILSSDELAQYLTQMFDGEKEYVAKAREIQQIFIHARENTSRQCFEEVVKIIDDQVTAQMDGHNEL